MGKTKKHLEELKGIIISLHKSDKSISEISKLHKVPLSSVHYIIKKFKAQGTTSYKCRSGRPRVTTSTEDLSI